MPTARLLVSMLAIPSQVPNILESGTYTCKALKVVALVLTPFSFCDTDIQHGGAVVTDGRCSMDCNGNSNDVCGGPNGLSMLFFNGWYSQGCWAEGTGGRVLPNGENVVGGSPNMTVENCVAACGKAGYKLAGVE